MLQAADFTWEQLFEAKEAVADVVIERDEQWSAVVPDLVEQRVSVESTKRLEPDLEARMRRAAGDVPVAFAFGPEYRYELLAAP